jgi:integrase
MTAQRIRDHLEPFLGGRLARSVRPDDLRAYRLRLEEKDLSPRTVRHLLTDVRCMLGWAVEAGHLERSPFPRRIMPRLQEARPDRLNDAEVLAILTIPEPQAFVIRLALGTGLRWGELCRAQAEHLWMGMLEVYRTKSGRGRRVPLTSALLAEIRARHGALVAYGEGSAGSFNKFVQRHSGVGRFHVHQLRHTFACRWIERGGSLASLQQVLGHASVTTTQHYARLTDELVRREAERISGT